MQKNKTDWSQYQKEIIELSGEGKSSKEILDALEEKYGDVFSRNADRTIRSLVPKNIKFKNTSAKILVFDIETAPMLAYAWNKYPDEISDNMIKEDWFVLCWSAKWLFGEEIFNDKLTAEELASKNDKRIAKSLWELIDEADIVIGHNAQRFDIPKINTRWIKHGVTRPSPYQVIDTLLHARKNFSITSNRLDYLARFFEVGAKLETEKNLWMKCMQGDYTALEHMQTYCDQDVRILESVYVEMRGWIQPHPNVALQAIADKDCCPVCSSPDREDCKTPYRTYVNEYNAYRCTNCDHIYRHRVTLTPLISNKDLKVSIPK